MNYNLFPGLLRAALAGFLSSALLAAAAEDSYRIKANHPRLIVEDVPAMAQRCLGPLG